MLPEFSDRHFGLTDIPQVTETLPPEVRHREQLLIELSNYLQGLTQTPWVFLSVGMVAKPEPRYQHDQEQLKQLLIEISELQHTIKLVTWLTGSQHLPEDTQCLLFNLRGELLYFGAAPLMPEWVAEAKLCTGPLKHPNEYHCYLLTKGLFTTR